MPLKVQGSDSQWACRAKQVKGAAGAEKLEVVTIYAKLNPQQQMMVFQSSPRDTRKAGLLCTVYLRWDRQRCLVPPSS